uniref:Heparan-sulfate 6-O-sulfotransferase n=1 Tax=Echeneis naucrates TaxID=173247 RepID=A0A665WB36_ECHNA
MEEKFNRLIFIPVAAVLFLMIWYQYLCPADSNTCSFGGDDKGLLQRYSSGFDLLHAEPDSDSDLPSKITSRFNFTERERDLDRHVAFDIRGDDVMVFLHIQKTGGTTFGRHLVKNIQLERPCDCVPGQRKCTCHRPGKAESWLFSRFSTGWSCGLHADWTELTSCVPPPRRPRRKTKSNGNFYYITMLRDPVSRYLSEWKHVQRGATWKTAIHMCDGRPPTQDELPACYSGEDWTGVPLADFMNCPSNLANNRQVRMLADLSLVGCYNMSSMSALERGQVLLASAKTNLRNMAFYGLTEFQRKTQYLFERTFGLRFIQAFTQINSTRAASVGISEKVRWRIEGLNALDVELYEYAKELFLQRYQYNRQRQHQEERRVAEEMATTTEDYSSQVERW